MKKGCIIVLAVLAVIVIGGVCAGVVAYNKMSAEMGLSEAPAFSSDTLAKPDTRVRAVLNSDKLIEFAQKHLPAEVTSAIPSWLPVSPENVVAMGMPREIALLGGSDYRAGKFNIELFVNERRGGPALVTLFREKNPLAGVPMIQWDPNLLVQPERGVLTLDGAMPIPDGLEDEILKTWSHEPAGDPLKIAGGHLFELYLDNRNGEILTLAGVILKSQGQDWKAIFEGKGDGDMSPGKMALPIIQQINYINAEADLEGMDTVKIVVRIFAGDKTKGILGLTTNMAVSQLQAMAQEKGLNLEGQFDWDDAQKAMVGNFTLTGIDELVTNSIKEAMASSR